MTKTVTIAVAMNVSVAAIERGESRPTPHTPWPLVQPLPSRVPKPTSRPAAISRGTEDVTAMSGRRISSDTAAAPKGSPTTNAAAGRQGGPASAIRTRVATIPLTVGAPRAPLVFDTVFVLVVVFTLVQGWSLPWVARRLGIVTPVTPREIAVESAPLEELDAELMQLTIPVGSRLHGVFLPELRLPVDAAVVLIVRDGHSFVPDDTTRLMRGDQALLVNARPEASTQSKIPYRITLSCRRSAAPSPPPRNRARSHRAAGAKLAA